MALRQAQCDSILHYIIFIDGISTGSV